MRAAIPSLLLATAPAIAQQLEPRADVACQMLVDTDGDGRQELIVVTQGALGNGVIARHDLAADGRTFALRDWVDVHEGRRMLLAAADVHPHAGVELVVADPSGIGWITWPADPAAHTLELRPLARRARFTLRTVRPQTSPFVRDLNRDGRLDLLLPTARGVMPFLQEAPGDDGEPRFRAMDLLPVPVQATIDSGSTGLDQELQGALTVPQIDTQDLNGDNRPDLLTQQGQKHAFWLQQADGTFGKPLEVDLAQFEDSTPKAAITPGSTLVLGDRQLLQRGDVDGDGIPDFVIAHRRKVWTFLSSAAGPQFTRARTQAVADDVTAMLVIDLDGDERAELLTFQLQVPGVGALLLGLVQSIDIDIKAVGYRSENGAFANTPTWRRMVTLRIPPILSLLSRQDELVKRFTDIVGKVRLGVRGPFTAAGKHDLAIVSGDGTALELHPRSEPGKSLDGAAGRRMLRNLLFDDPNTVFDIDRLFGLVSGLLDEVAGELAAGDAAAASVPLRDGKQWRIADLLVGELDGKPGAEIVAVYDEIEPTTDAPRRAYDVIVWPPTSTTPPAAK